MFGSFDCFQSAMNHESALIIKTKAKGFDFGWHFNKVNSNILALRKTVLRCYFSNLSAKKSENCVKKDISLLTIIFIWK